MTVTDSSGTITRVYDSLNRIISYTNTSGQTIGYEYDSVGNLTKLTYPDGKIVRYSYNANNQLAKVQDWANRITIYTYDNNGRLSKTTRPDGSVETYTYNANGQLTNAVDKKADGSIINEYSYGYDADGNVITENSANEPSSITIPSNQMEYGLANRLTNFNGTAISYDADGNMLSTPLGENWGNLSYNSLNYLTNIMVSSSTVLFSCTYDAEGNRTAKVENGIITNFTVNPNAELSQVLMSTKNGETTYYVYGLGLISQENADGYKLYHYDYRGSTTAITNSNGEVTDTVFYDPYGNIISRTGTTDTPFLYVGKYGVEIDNSGLYYMRARYYNPQIERFINVDPIRDGYNWYEYVEGSSINRIDPLGLEEIYIFYNKGDENNGSLKDRAEKKQKEMQGLGKSVYFKEIVSDQEFADEWAKMNNNGKQIETVYLFFHSNPYSLIMNEGAVVTETRDSSDFVQLKDLKVQNIGTIVMNSCNSAHLDHSNTNLAFEFSKYQNVENVYGWDGSMKWSITGEPILNFDNVYFFFHNTADDNKSDLNPNLYFDSWLTQGTSRKAVGQIKYVKKNNDIFVLFPKDDIYNYQYVYDLNGKDVSNRYEKQTEPVA